MSLRSTNPYVAAALEDWRRAGLRPSIPRSAAAGAGWQPAAAAGSSSFGMSGTNAHVLLSVPRARQAPSDQGVWQRTRWGRISLRRCSLHLSEEPLAACV